MTSSRTSLANLVRIRLMGTFPGRNPGSFTFCWIFATTRSVSRAISSTGTLISISCLQPSMTMVVGCGLWDVGKTAQRRAYNLPPTTYNPILRSFVPTCQVVLLLERQAIDFHGHGFELHASDLFVEFFGNSVDTLFEAGMVF